MKVLVAMSGGVDSSLSAALLKEAGHEVEGAYMLGWQPEFLSCPAEEDRKDAMKVALHLGIPFHTLDFSDLYKREVIDYMTREYGKGRTPNPDIMCNKHVKFGAFFDWAKEHGFDAIATGHYAQTKEGALLKAVDANKDQTYFLWAIPKDVLRHVQFPIGHLLKSQVREEALKRDLPTAQRKESQGVCFLGKIDMQEFLKRELPHAIGDVVDENGTKIGTHEGALLYTIGQRHGFTVNALSNDEAPRYVVAKSLPDNTITVSADRNWGVTAVEGNSIAARYANWLGELPKISDAVFARIRHRQELFPCTILKIDADGFAVALKEPMPHAPGQSIVLYREDTCLGGGVIE